MTRFPDTRAAAAVAAFVLAAGLVGCGKTTLNTARGEKKIAAIVLERTGEKVTVSCPRDVPIRQSERTTCTITGADGSRATATMVQTDEKGNVRVSSHLMATAFVQGKIARDATAKLGFPVKIDCPDVVDLPGRIRVRCTAKDPKGQTAPAYVTISADGNVTYRIPPRSG